MSLRLTAEADLRAAVVATARGELGKHYGVGAWTPYGEWYGPGWGNAYFCAAGASWSPAIALGEDDARFLKGYQTHGGTAPRRRGFIWTVAVITQHRPRTVPLRDLQPGDSILYRYNSGDNRQGNEVNHEDLVEVNHPTLGYVDCVGFNVPKPGAPAGSDPGRGGGVWRRRIYYNNPWIVAGIQYPYAALAQRNRALWAPIQQHLHDLGFGTFTMSGIYGPATRQAITDYASTTGYRGSLVDPRTLLTHLENTMSNVLTRMARVEKHLGLDTPAPPAPPPAQPTIPPSWRKVVGAPNGLNVRRGPGANNPIVGTARNGDLFRVALDSKGRPVTNGDWTQGRTDAMRDAGANSGWVASRFLGQWS